MSAAVNHLLRQMQSNGRLAYLIGPGSESYELLTLEGAKAAGRDVSEYRKTFEATLQFERWPAQGDIADRLDAGAKLLAAVQRLEQRGFFAASTCADKPTNADMQAVLAAMSHAEDCLA